MFPCRNHPQLTANRVCTHCGQPYCDSCLVEFLGHPHCGQCRDIRLRSMQPPRKAFTYAQLRDRLLLAAVLIFAVGQYFFRFDLWWPNVVLGALLGLVLLGALVIHVLIATDKLE